MNRPGKRQNHGMATPSPADQSQTMSFTPVSGKAKRIRQSSKESYSVPAVQYPEYHYPWSSCSHHR